MVTREGQGIRVCNGQESIVFTLAQALMLVGQLNNAIEDIALEMGE